MVVLPGVVVTLVGAAGTVCDVTVTVVGWLWPTAVVAMTLTVAE